MSKSVERNAALFAAARVAGLEAGAAAVPVPMVVTQRASPLNDASAVVNRYVAPDGVCGFAGVIVAGNSSFGRFAKRASIGRNNYGGGIYIRIPDHGQSLARKEAHAAAFAQVLNANGVDAYVDSRMD